MINLRGSLPPLPVAVALTFATMVMAVTGCDLTHHVVRQDGPGRHGGPAAAGRPGSAPAAGTAGNDGGPGSTFVAAENAKPGTADWRVRHGGAPHEIEGYADHVSVLPGQPFRLFVSTRSKGYTVEAFRMGWYGGAQARLVWRSGRMAGSVQAPARIEGKTNTVVAPWHPSLTVPTTGWPEGDYLVRLDADTGAQHYVPITLRSAAATGKIVLLNGTTTWQAYNLWGGRSLYSGPYGFASRSRAVSFDRPYDKSGATKFLAYEQPAVALAEKLGLPLAYATDNDLHRDPNLLRGARALTVLGHDEYWSSVMRRRVTGARDQGVNIAFLGANELNRHIRFAPTKLGQDRLVICYKEADDPIAKDDPSEVTVDWRFADPPRPESDLTGVYYECNPVQADYVVYDPKNWLFAGTGVRRGQRFTGMVGPEYDRVNPIVPTPRPIEVLAHSPLTCNGSSSYADSAYYTVPSGAGVFAAGTMRWVCALRGTKCGHDVPASAAPFVAKVTTTLLRAFAAGPAGRTHPARDNLAAVHPYKGYPGAPGDDRASQGD
ncbi:MAG TPA: N,N-dimethylformamidase beta subunit family domain-containing protein [Streptosporangiaceae bacterium]